MILRAPPREGTRDESADTVLVLGKKRYAVGLIWFTADAELAETTALVKQRAKHLSADFYCSRMTIASQQGFGFLDKGHRMSMPSAAALAADALIGEWHGIFAADNGWWYVCVHSDAVAPEGDRFFHSEEEAYNHFIQASESYKWPRSYAPAAWNLPNTNGEIALERLLEEHGAAAAALRPITLDAFFGGAQRKKVVLSSTAVFILLVLAMISVLAAASPGSRKLKENISPFVLSMPVGDVIKPPPSPPLRKGGSGDIALQIAPPEKVLAACMTGFDKLMIPLPGWDMLTLSCDGVRASVEWKKVSGSLMILQTALVKFPRETMVSYTGADRFVATLSIPVVKTRPSRVMNLDTAILSLNKRFADTGSIQIKPVIPKAPRPVATQRPAARRGGAAATPPVPPPVAPPPYLDFTLISSTPPTSLSWAFDVAGLKLQDVRWDLGSRSWTYKAQVLFNNEVASNARTSP